MAGPMDEKEMTRNILQAIKAVARNKDRVKKHGLSFFVGMSYALGTCWCFGAYPQYFWLWYMVSFAILLPLNIIQLRRSGKTGVFKEFCWYANIAANCSGVLLLCANWMAFSQIASNGTWARKMAFCGAFSIGTGVLPVMVIFNQNSLVFDRVPAAAETFIHLLPNLVMFTIHWQREALAQAFPVVFPEPTGIKFEPQEFFYAMGCFYAPWWVGYTTYCATWHIHTRPKTLDFFHQQMDMVRQVLPLCLRRRYTAKIDEPVAIDVIIYTSCHAIWVAFCTIVSIICYNFWAFHVLLNTVTAAFVAYGGSMRYAVLTSTYDAVMYEAVDDIYEAVQNAEREARGQLREDLQCGLLSASGEHAQ